ncbi:MAG TPA: FecR domain-containing protein [Thermoanaerobaculia bacterium]|nr:FecR domain-containing protein [Thermoanaerobaculia bacterium]
MADRKAARPTKDWYSVSVDTLRGWALLLTIIVLLVASYFGYRLWERRSLEREAAQVLEETADLFQRLQNEKRAASFGKELNAAHESFDQARNRFLAKEFRQSLSDGLRSRGVLLHILDSLALPSGASQANFLSVQGEVEYRRGEGGEWEEARSRLPLRPGDYVRTSGSGSAEIMFTDGTLYTVRPNTQFIVSAGRSAPGRPAEQTIQMEYGWVDLNTTQNSSQVRTPGAVAEVRKDSEAFVAFDKDSNRGRFGAYRGGMELAAKGGMKQEVNELQQVVQTGDLLSAPSALPGRPELLEPAHQLSLDMNRQRTLVLAWEPVTGASRYKLEVSRNNLFVDNVVQDPSRAKTRATLSLRGEGTFLWRVAALGGDGMQGPWSPAREFRVSALSAESGERDKTPPKLDLDDVKSYGSIFIVDGRSEPGSRIEVNGEQVKVAADGSFTKTVQLNKEGWSFIEIKAYDTSGNVAVQNRRVFVENP